MTTRIVEEMSPKMMVQARPENWTSLARGVTPRTVAMSGRKRMRIVERIAWWGCAPVRIYWLA